MDNIFNRKAGNVNLKINAESAKVTLGMKQSDVEVELEDVDRDEILDAIRDDDGGLAGIVNHLGPGELLFEIGPDEAKDYFNLVDKDE